MSESLAERFCLRNGRKSFSINPHDDPEFFFGRTDIQKEVMSRVKKDIALHTPIKLLVVGDYGTGKTHLLRHLEYRVEHDNLGVHVVYLAVGDLSKKSKFAVLYRSIMKTIGLDELLRLLRELESRSNLAELEDHLESIAKEESGNKSVSRMLRQAVIQKDNQTVLLDIWRWLIGEGIKSDKMDSYGVSSSLSELGDFLRVLMAIARLYELVDGKQLLVLVDEAEWLRLVSDDDAMANWANALRELYDDDNSSLGIIFALGAAGIDADDIPEMFRERGVRSRLVNRIVNLGTFAEEEVASFLRDLIGELTDESCVKARVEAYPDMTPATYPFTQDAWVEFVSLISADVRLSKPRVAIKTLNEYVAEAFMADSHVIDSDMLGRMPPISE